MSDLNLNPQERQRLISMYITQYNQTYSHITRLFDTLDDIRNNINTLLGNNIYNIHMNPNQNQNQNQNQTQNQNQIFLRLRIRFWIIKKNLTFCAFFVICG